MEEKIDKNHQEKPLILMVDDSPKDLQVMASILTNAGYRITSAKSAARALQILDNITPDLILLDVMMPEMYGFELCRRLKSSETTRVIPVIFLTIKTESEDIVKGFQSGGVDYITKPFNKTELLARMQNHLELKKSKEELKEKSKEIEEKNRKLEEQSEKLKELDKIKTRFSANISHEFRTSLIEKEEKGPFSEPETGSDETNIILVVEDNAVMRKYITRALEQGCNVVTAVDGREGIQKAQEIIPDLIISDIMMPEVDGLELCRVLKNDVKTSHIPIVLLTAKASEENILQGLETGADDYITKPFNTKILIARVKNLIDIRRQLQNNINREMNLQPVKTSVSKIDKKFLRDLQAVIKKNISDPEFNVEELSKKLYMGYTTLYRKIKALYGHTPTEFIRSCRLKQALQLLKGGYVSVTDVAFKVGFSSRAYFTKCFREKFHQLPSDFN